MKTPKTRSYFIGITTLSLAAALVACSGTPVSTSAPAPVTQELGSPGSAYAVVDGQVVPVPNIPMGSQRTIDAILDEGKNRNQVMDHLTHICEVFGPRLTASTSLQEANDWAAARFTAWGLSNVENRIWGEATLRFDRGPSYGRVLRAEDAEAAPEEVRPLEFTTLSWAPGTEGPKQGPVVRMPTTLEEVDANSGSYAGAWVLHSPYQGGRQGIRGVGAAMAARHALRAEVHQMIEAGETLERPSASVMPVDGISGSWLGTASGPSIPNGETPFALTMSVAEDGTATGTIAMPAVGMVTDMVDGVYADGLLEFIFPTPAGDRAMTFPVADGTMRMQANDPDSGAEYTFDLALQPESREVDQGEVDRYIMYRVISEGPHGFISSSRDERVWTTSVKRGQELLNLTMADVGKDVEVNVRDSDYRYINSDLADGQRVYLEFDLSHRFQEGPIPLYNTIAEIPGTEKPDEVVIVSAHIDSWNGPGSQGTLDNGTGTAVTLEAARILAAVGAKPKRTIRFILWTGEEQGLLGSRAYVESLSEDERAKISAVFVDDGGTNYEGGLPAADVMVEYLAAATAPTNGRFFSETDRATLLADDNPDNDDRAGWLDVNIRPTGMTINTHSGSDHAPFNDVGIPGFFWDEVGRSDYRYGWHTQNDSLDLAIPEYLVQSATNAAITAYNLACAPELLPRGSDSGNDMAGR